jgi:hypothetical protein
MAKGHHATVGWRFSPARPFFVAVAMANRLSAPLNEDVTPKARRAWLTERTENYNAIRPSDSEFQTGWPALVRRQLAPLVEIRGARVLCMNRAADGRFFLNGRLAR